jgi:hypothetical protein
MIMTTINSWINHRIANTTRSMDSLLAGVRSTFKAGTITIPDDIDLLEQELVCKPASTDLDHLYYHLIEREGGKSYDTHRVVHLMQLRSIPLDARGDVGAVAKMQKILRGVANANLEVVYIVAGIFRPERLGIVQFYGVVGHHAEKETAMKIALHAQAALEAGMAANYPQIRFCPPSAATAEWLNLALKDMPHAILTIGHPDPRENARGGASEFTALLGGGGGKKGGAPNQYTMQQNEIVMRGMAALEEEFLLQVLLTPVSMTEAARLVTGLAEYDSSVSAWQQGTRSFNVGTSLPLIFSGALTHGVGSGYTEAVNLGVAEGVNHSDSQTHVSGVADTHTEGVAVTDGFSTGHTESQSTSETHTEGQSVTDGQSSGVQYSSGANMGVSAGVNLGVNAGFQEGWSLSKGSSYDSSHSETQNSSDSVTTVQSQSDSLTQSRAVTQSQSDAHTVSESDAVGSSDGTSKVLSQGSSEAVSRALNRSFAAGASYGLAPSFSMGEANQWQNSAAGLLRTILQTQLKLLNSMTLEGGFYADVYALTATERGKMAMLALIPEAFHGEEDVVMGVQTRTLVAEEEEYIRAHARLLVPSTREIHIPEAMSGYADSTLISMLQAAAYMAPGLMEEGIARTVQEAMPPFAFDPLMAGEVILGHQISTERAALTHSLLRLTQARHFHTAFVADTGFGKSIAAERLAYETTSKWHYRTIILDFGQGWRKALNWPGMDGRVDIRQLYPGAVRPIRWNPLQVPRRIAPSNYRNLLAELFANAGRMGPRQLGFMREALTRVYQACGVIVDETNSQSWDVVRDDDEDAAISTAQAEHGLPLRKVLQMRVSGLSTHERQALFVLRSRNASLRAWVEELKKRFKLVSEAKDQASRTSLEGVLLRLTPLAEEEMVEMYGPGFDTIAIEELGLLGENSPWGIAILEGGGAQMDEFSKSALLSLIAAILYNDAVTRRREALGGAKFPPMQIFFEEANKVLTGVNTGATSDKEATGNQTAEAFTTMWRDGRKYKCFMHILAQTISEIPPGILSSCNNAFFGQTKNDRDRQEVLAHLARSTKGFVNSEYDRFLARMPIAMSIVKLGYTQEIIEAEPFLIRPMMLDVMEPSDAEILKYYQNLVL